MPSTPRSLATLVVALSIMQAACAQSQDDYAEEVSDGLDPADYDPVVLNPDYYSVLLEDARVRVLDWNLPAGKSDSMHYQPDYGAYFIKGSQVRVLPLERFSGSFDIPDGTPMVHAAWYHRVQNLGSLHLHAVIVEMKDGAAETAGSIPDGMSAEVVAPEVYTVIDEDYHMRILDMKLPAGETDGDHAHTAEVVYVLEGGIIRVHLPDGQTSDLTLDSGSVLSNNPSQHRIENIGDTDFHAVIFELKEPPVMD